MPALNTNTELERIKTGLLTMLKTNGFTFDVQIVSRKGISPEAGISPDNTPAIMVHPGKDTIVERGIRENHRNWNIVVAAYLAQQNLEVEEEEAPPENDPIEKSIEALKKDTINLLQSIYEAPVDPILWAEVGEIDAFELDEQRTDAAFMVGLDVHYLM